MNITKSGWASVGASLLLAACGGGGGGNAVAPNANPGSGELVQNPPVRTLSITAADFSTELQAGGAAGQTLLGLATAGTGSATLPCGVDVQYIKYGTVGGKGEATQATGALMVPTGPGANCSGARPIVLFAHGTAIEKRYNIADLVDTSNPAYSEASLVASQFAAKGFIVVAPNYAGFDASTLPYHPFLVLSQQSQEMVDALKAARSALPKLLAPVADNGKLFITGISQGGAVAMATHKAMDAQGMAVNGSAPIEPVSALSLYGDYVIAGHVPVASTVLIPMLINGYQKTYGGIYTSPADYYEANYAPGMEAAFPGSYSYTSIFTSNIVPQLHLFTGTAPTDSSPSLNALWASGFGSNNLMTTATRGAYLAAIGATGGADQGTGPASNPGHPLRTRMAANDLRSWTGPTTAPMLICAGSNDPTVFYGTNAGVTANLLAASPLVKIFDLENLYPGYAGAHQLTGASATALQSNFASAVTATASAAGTDPVAQSQAVAKDYHGKLAPPFCAAAASGFFAVL